MKGREQRVITGPRRFLPLAALVLTLSGCVQETVNGSEATYRAGLWVPIAIALAGVVSLTVGLALRKKSPRFSGSFVILGPAAIFWFAPSTYFDRAVVNDKTFYVQTGIYGGTVHTIALDDVRSVRMTSEVSATSRNRPAAHFFNFDSKTGGSQKVPIDSKVVEAALPRLFRQLESRGIRVTN